MDPAVARNQLLGLWLWISIYSSRGDSVSVQVFFSPICLLSVYPSVLIFFMLASSVREFRFEPLNPPPSVPYRPALPCPALSVAEDRADVLFSSGAGLVILGMSGHFPSLISRMQPI